MTFKTGEPSANPHGNPENLKNQDKALPAGTRAARARLAAGEPTPQQECFVKEYVRDFDITNAYKRAGYSTKTAKQNAFKLFNKPHVKAAIQRELEKRYNMNEVTVRAVVARINRIAEQAEAESEYQAALRACELLGKYLGMFIEKRQSDVRFSVSTPGEVDARIEELLKLAAGEAELDEDSPTIGEA